MSVEKPSDVQSPPAMVPAARAYLLRLPVHAHLGTIRPDLTVQVNPMWFELDGDHLLLSHSTSRAKYRNLMNNPSMSVSLQDPVLPKQRLELRGRLVEVRPDEGGRTYIRMARRYGREHWHVPPPDVADRVVLVMSIEHTTMQ